MVKNLVTISLMIFIIMLLGILGASVFLNQGKNSTLSNVEQIGSGQNINTTSSANQSRGTVIQGDDEDNNSDDEEGESVSGGVSTKPSTSPAPTIPASTTPATTGGITLSQVAQHNVRSSCWMIISNKVYNFTSYMNAHPGGVSTILQLCGKDGTVAFATKGGQGTHSQTAYNLLVNYYVGNLSN